MTALPLAGCTFGWLHQAPLADALRELAAHDVRAVERQLAAEFELADAYPAPCATLGIGMTMGYIAGRHAATSLE
jgi:hypothetical protein